MTRSSKQTSVPAAPASATTAGASTAVTAVRKRRPMRSRRTRSACSRYAASPACKLRGADDGRDLRVGERRDQLGAPVGVPGRHAKVGGHLAVGPERAGVEMSRPGTSRSRGARPPARSSRPAATGRAGDKTQRQHGRQRAAHLHHVLRRPRAGPSRRWSRAEAGAEVDEVVPHEMPAVLLDVAVERVDGARRRRPPATRAAGSSRAASADLRAGSGRSDRRPAAPACRTRPGSCPAAS